MGVTQRQTLTLHQILSGDQTKNMSWAGHAAGSYSRLQIHTFLSVNLKASGVSAKNTY
jgi:hypothetical protein